MFYTKPEREKETYSLPDAEVFYLEENEMESNDPDSDFYPAGWYYWYCLPGCLPDSEPMGPFETEQEAIDDAIEQNTEY